MKALIHRTILIALVATAAVAVPARSSAQKAIDNGALLTMHWGLKPTGTPPKIAWKPGAEDAKRFEYYTAGNLETTEDTSFDVGGSERLVFFRTQVPRDPESGFCEGCADWISLARMGYDDAQKPVKGDFTKWFLLQGTLDGQRKPELVLQNNWPIAVKITSSDGFMEGNTTQEHYYSFPEMKPILQVKTSEFTEERGGPHGPVSNLVERRVRFIPADAENTGHHEVEVSGEDGTRILRWSEAEHKYLPKKEQKPTPGALPKGTSVRPAVKVPAKPTLKKP